MPARTVTLELLRHGPSNNQLLSPLTPYLALSGNYDAETVHVGFEHVQMLRRMRGLRYQDGRAGEVAALEEASAEVSRLFASVRSLSAEISSIPRGSRDVIHLRLVLSASELSLLPFELVRSPAGFPGHGQWLSLQTAAPIALTREVRRVSASTIRWPDRPRILLVAAQPPGVAKVPLRAHLLALRWALSPWLYSGRAEELGKHVTVLPRATLSAVRDECARAAGSGAPYTHVHVLAHGVPDEAVVDAEHGFGLAFHQDGDPNRMDVVSGTRLAAALRCHPSGPIGGQLSGPAVVTVASCDSANVGSVLAAGASIAHQLHEAGVPLVLASQFPLSVRGSAVMAEVVYTRLLRGEDPRLLVHDLRQTLHVTCPDTHDWASVVAYAALPPDIDAQVKRAKQQRALAAVDAAITRRDLAERTMSKPGRAGIEDLGAAMSWLKSTLPAEDEPVSPGERARAYGVLAAASKRVAQVRFPAALWPILKRPGAAPVSVDGEDLDDDAPPSAPVAAPGATPVDQVAMLQASPAPKPEDPEAATRAADQAEARRLLEEARRYYLEVFRKGCTEAWPLVQYLACGTALFPADRDLPSRERVDAERSFTSFWTTAYVLADDNLKNARGREVAWAHAALVELYVLAQLLPSGHWARPEAEDRARRHVDALLASGTDLDKYSLRRQLIRYADWWWKGREDIAALPRTLAARMSEMGVGHTHVEG
jgi:hypothetical protein